MFGFNKTEKETSTTEKSGVWTSQLNQAIADARKGGVGSAK